MTVSITADGILAERERVTNLIVCFNITFVFGILMTLFILLVHMDEIEIQQHYDEFFEEIYVEMEKVGPAVPQLFIEPVLNHINIIVYI